MTQKEARDLIEICGGVPKVADVLGEPAPNLRHRLNGFLKWTQEYEIRLLSALSDLGVWARLKRLEKAFMELERVAGICQRNDTPGVGCKLCGSSEVEEGKSICIKCKKGMGAE